MHAAVCISGKLLAECTAALPQLLDDLRELVLVESPSADHDAVRRSAAVTARIGTERLGVAPDTIDIDGCTHLRWRLGTGPRRLLLLAHHDTVWPIGSLQSHPFTAAGGTITGPGCFDMKTGTAMALTALALVRRTGGLDGISLLVTGDEELGSPSSRALIEAEAAGCRAALVLEPSGPGGAVKTARKGVSIYRIAVTGRAAHAGLEPEKGVNAALALAELTPAVAAVSDPDAGTTVTPTVLRAGTTSNTVPADAELTVDVRAWSAAEQQRIDRAIRALRPTLLGATISVDGSSNRPPFEADMAADLFPRAQRVASEIGLPSLVDCGVGGGSDGNFTAGIGVPTLDGLGAVGGGAHADDEHVEIDEIPRRTALLVALITELAGSGR
ncbi:MAG: M20 family metallopeptidase [Mycobacteriales bacterium]